MSLTILLHSSKTMSSDVRRQPLSQSEFIKEATQVNQYLRTLDSAAVQKHMHVSAKLAENVIEQVNDWSSKPGGVAAVESFRGHIFSGLRALDFSDKEVDFAQKHLRLLSGLYGIIRPYDDVRPYRCEAGYKFADDPFKNMYRFWGGRLAATLPADGPIINVTSGEYEKLILPYIDTSRVITPKFLTIHPTKKTPVFVAVHAKIARGAYARWLIQRGKDSVDELEKFKDLGYEYDPVQSTPQQPVYICKDFKGLGLSVRTV